MIAWLRKLSWKWKLTVVFVVGFIVLMGVIMSADGQAWMAKKVIDKYNETPESERADSPWADRWLALAFFRGSVCGDSKAAQDMYRDFLGLEPDDKGKTVFENRKLHGHFCSPDGKIGWGPNHPRAPEAYWSYLEYYEIENSSQYTSARCWEYYSLLYEWMRRSGPTKKPNPNFKQYWEKVKDLAKKSPFPSPPGLDQSAKDAPNVDPVN